MAAVEKTATLEFEEYPGDEVVVRIAPVPMDDYFEILEGLDTSRNAKQLRAVFRRFAEVALISWTFPEPADGDGMLRRDFNLGIAMVRQWSKGVRDVPLPLPVGSSGGEPSEEQPA